MFQHPIPDVTMVTVCPGSEHSNYNALSDSIKCNMTFYTNQNVKVILFIELDGSLLVECNYTEFGDQVWL